MPVTATTTLPDEDQPVLSNGVEDEIGVDRETQRTNYGDIRWQVRETGESSWSASAEGFAENTVAFGTITFDITGREDGEEYEVRLRSETEHRTGAWTTPTAIITKFPGATNIGTTNVAATSLDVTWDDNSDNEDGFDVERRREYISGFGAWQTLSTEAPNTTSYTDSTVLPETTYEYRIRAFTDDASDTSASTQVTTSSAGLRQRDAPARGWFVEIDHPNRSTPRVLQPGSEARAQPQLNGLPEAIIPVRRADHWTDSSTWERQAMRVWRDGERLPIERVDEVRETPGGVELVGRGGVDLLDDYAKNQNNTNAHDVMRDILSGTSYDYTVDAVPTEDNRLFAVWDTTTEFEENQDPFSIRDARTGDEPFDTSGDELKLHQTGYLVAPSQIGTGSNSGVTSDSSNNWTNDEALEIDAGNREVAEWDIDLEYPLNAEDVGLEIRAAYDAVKAYVIVDIDNRPVYAKKFDTTSSGRSVEWKSADTGNDAGFGAEDPVDLDAGTHTIRVETDITDANGTNTLSSTSGTVWLDTAILYDQLIYGGSGGFVNTLDSNAKLDGPPGLYDEDVYRAKPRPVFRSTGGRVEASVNKTVNNWAIRITGGNNTNTTTSDTLEIDFGTDDDRWFTAITLDGFDATTIDTTIEKEVTEHKTEPIVVDALTIKYDALESPTVDGFVSGRREELLNQLTDRGDDIWEVQYDESTDNIRVVVTRPGQRTTDADPDVADYTAAKSTADEISRAVIRGRTERVDGESFVADTNGTQLDNDRIQRDSERVYDSGTGDEFRRGDDYEMDYLNGVITIFAGGGMTDGNTYSIDYREKAFSEASRAVSFDVEAGAEFPSLTTDSECREAAQYLLDALDAPQYTASVTIPRREAGFNLVELLSPSALPSPSGAGYRVRSIDEQPREIQLTLGSRGSVGEEIQRLRSLLSETAREV